MKSRPSIGLGALLLAAQLAVTPPPTAPVADAAERNDGAEVRRLLESGADVNAPQGDGMTALHWAAYNGNVDIAAVVLEAGADPMAPTRIGAYTPLHLAAQAGSEAVVEALLAAGANPNARTVDVGGATPLHFAAQAGDPGTVLALLERGVDIDAREQAWGQTPLMFAAAADRLEAVKVLLARGADPSIASRFIDVPARAERDRIAQERRDEVMKAQAEGRDPVFPDEAKTAAEAAAREARLEARRAAVDANRPIEEPEPLSYADLVAGHGGLTALLHAAREGHRDVAIALVDAGADIDQPSDGDQTTPMLMAMINGHFDLAMELFERGADPEIASDAGATPLFAALNTHWAPKSRFPQQHAYERQKLTYLDVMRRLLDAGVDPNKRLTKHLWYMSYNFDLLQIDVAGATPFWRAAYALDGEAMRLLVSYGADPSIPTQTVPQRRRGRGPTGPDPSGLPPVPVGGPAVYPIHAASGVGYGEGYAANAHRHVPDGWLPAVRYLVEELGADVNARDYNGYAPLHHAAARGDNELIEYLVSRGADVTLVSRAGQTTADMANGPYQRTQPYPETVALLESLGSKNNHHCLSCD
jgi:ankyrin repeat protein